MVRAGQPVPMPLKILAYALLVALGLGWHFRCSGPASVRRMKVGALSVLIPAGAVVSHHPEYLDYPQPRRPRLPRHETLRITLPGLKGAVLLVETSAWRLGAERPATGMAELYPKLESGALKEYRPVRRVSGPDSFRAGNLPAYGGWWLLEDGSDLLCAYAAVKRDLYFIVMKLPGRPSDPEQQRARVLLWTALQSMTPAR